LIKLGSQGTTYALIDERLIAIYDTSYSRAGWIACS